MTHMDYDTCEERNADLERYRPGCIAEERELELERTESEFQEMEVER